MTDVPFDPQKCLKCHYEMQPEVSSALERQTLNFLLEGKVIADLPCEFLFLACFHGLAWQGAPIVRCFKNQPLGLYPCVFFFGGRMLVINTLVS